MTNIEPVIMGMAGLGGYARHICDLLREQSAAPEPPVRLTAVCEPNLEAHADLAADLRRAGIAVCSRWEDLLALPVEAVWLPLPTPLHRPFTQQSLAAGKAVMCEKPAAGSVQDLDAMREARDSAALPAVIGFQDIYEPTTLALKRAILADEIGEVRSASLTACWPRDSRYYARSSWAGRQKQDGAWVMDSPASNALAHYVNLALFLLGRAEGESSLPVDIEAELYRANPIENYDTCGLRIGTDSGASLLVLLTHACRESGSPRIVFHGERGTIAYVSNQQAEIHTEAGTRRIGLAHSSRTPMVQRFANLVRGVPDERPVATLEVARAHLIAVNGASEAVPVRTVPEEYVDVLPQAEGELRTIAGIEALFAQCAERGCLPHESGLAPWTSPAGRRDLLGYSHFAGPAS